MNDADVWLLCFSPAFFFFAGFVVGGRAPARPCGISGKGNGSNGLRPPRGGSGTCPPRDIKTGEAT